MSEPEVSQQGRRRKIRRGAVVAAIAAGSVTFSASTVSAAPQRNTDYWCFGCVVLAAGPAADTGKVLVLLQDPDRKFAKVWFDAQKNPDQILATALAAITSRKTVGVNLLGTTHMSVIDRMYLERDPRIASS